MLKSRLESREEEEEELGEKESKDPLGEETLIYLLTFLSCKLEQNFTATSVSSLEKTTLVSSPIG